MSEYTPSVSVTARTAHRCTNCGEAINPGEVYKKWASFGDGTAYTNKMHPECLESLQEDSWDCGGRFEYTPYSGERPIKEPS